MATLYGANVVTDGLVLHLDAANVKSYPGTGTTWYDLSGNGNDGAFINSTYFSESKMILDGVDDYISLNDPQSLNPGASSFTIDAWVNQKDTGFNGIVEARGSGLHGFLFILNYSVPGQCGLFLNTTLDTNQNVYRSSVTTFFDTSIWMNVSVVVDRINENISFYKNGIMQGNYVNITSSGTVDGGSYRYWVGGDLGGAEANMDISLIRQYNYALTASEIRQNFEAMRGRYGI